MDLCSGSQQSKEIARPLLEGLGQGIFDFGETAGGANVVKVAGNFMIMASMEMMAEAYTLAEKNGLDRLKVAEFSAQLYLTLPFFKTTDGPLRASNTSLWASNQN